MVNVALAPVPAPQDREARHRAAHQRCSTSARTAARTFEDFRPEVHDSDGLLINCNSGEWLWRPIDNPRAARGSAASAPPIRSASACSSATASFDHYQDLETRPELRPSVWVAPAGRLGRGQRRAGRDPHQGGYERQHRRVLGARTNRPNRARWGRTPTRCIGTVRIQACRRAAGVVATRRDRGTADNAYRFVIDFDGKKLDSLPEDTVLRGVVTIASGDDSAELLDQQVVKNPGHRRLAADVPDPPVEERSGGAARLPRSGRQVAHRDLVGRHSAHERARRVGRDRQRQRPAGRSVRPAAAGLEAGAGARPRLPRGPRGAGRRARRRWSPKRSSAPLHAPDWGTDGDAIALTLRAVRALLVERARARSRRRRRHASIRSSPGACAGWRAGAPSPRAADLSSRALWTAPPITRRPMVPEWIERRFCPPHVQSPLPQPAAVAARRRASPIASSASSAAACRGSARPAAAASCS